MENTIPKKIHAPLFSLGRVLITPGARDAFAEHYEKASRAIEAHLVRHMTGDWGTVDADDWAANDNDAKHGGRILSAYRLRELPGEAAGTGARVWIITEWNREYTTILLPDEY